MDKQKPLDKQPPAHLLWTAAFRHLGPALPQTPEKSTVKGA